MGVWFHCGEMLKLGNRSNQPQQTGVELMKRFTTILLAIAVGGMLVSLAVAKDTGSRDALRLSDARLEEGEWKFLRDRVEEHPFPRYSKAILAFTDAVIDETEKVEVGKVEPIKEAG